MPLQACSISGKRGTRWGRKGKCYAGVSGKARARKQMQAILASGWTGNAAPKRRPNPLRADPTRTASIRRRFAAALRRKFRGVMAAVRRALVEQDQLGLAMNAFCPTGPGGGVDPTCSPSGATDLREKNLPFDKERGEARRMGARLAKTQKLTKDQDAVVNWYRDGGYTNINQQLRERAEQPDLLEQQRKDWGAAFTNKQAIEHLDAVLNKSSLPEAMVVYRGLRQAADGKRLLERQPGDVVRDEGFLSTSLSPQSAYWSFAHEGTGSGVLLRIVLPKGFKAAYISGSEGVESEVLLQRGVSFEVVGMTERADEHGRKYKEVSLRPIQEKTVENAKDDPVIYPLITEEDETRGFKEPAEARPEGVANVEGCGAGAEGDPGFQEGNTCGRSLGEGLKSVSVLPAGTAASRMDVATAKDIQRRLHRLHEESPEFRSVVFMLDKQTKMDAEANVVQAIARAVRRGKDPLRDKKVALAVKKWNEDIREEYRVGNQEIVEYAKHAKNYLDAMDSAPRSSEVLYRGQRKSKWQEGEVVEWEVPTSASQSQDVGAHYATGEILRIRPGARYLSVDLLGAAGQGPEGGVYAHRSKREGYSKQASYYDATMGSDLEVLTAGRFKVASIKEDYLSYNDQLEMKRRTKKFRIVDLEPIEEHTTNAPRTDASRFTFRTTPERLAAFVRWLKRLVEAELLDANDPSDKEAYWQAYVEEGFRQGAGRAFDDVHKSMRREAIAPWYEGSREEFLRSAFGQPVQDERVKLLAGRVFTELQGISDRAGTEMARSLTESMMRGRGAVEAMRDLQERAGLSQERALLIARTETIRAHAEGQLAAMGEMGVDAVGVMVEWDTAHDDRVCPKCEDLQGIVLTLEEARGMIPRHPNCRCSYVPANVGESEKGQKRTAEEIGEAVAESIAGEKNVTWQGADLAPAEARPEGVANVEGCGAGEEGDPGFQEGNVCGASKGSPGRTARSVGFDEDPWKMAKYKGAPDLRRDITDMTGAKKVRSELQKQGRLNQDGKTTSLYHITDPEYVTSILKDGLIPGKEKATGQQWKAAHSDYATYFYLDKGVALDHAEQAGGMKVLEAKIPITPKSLIRILPDEDSDPNPKNGVKVLLEGGTVAYVGGVPSTHLSLVKSKGPE